MTYRKNFTIHMSLSVQLLVNMHKYVCIYVCMYVLCVCFSYLSRKQLFTKQATTVRNIVVEKLHTNDFTTSRGLVW